MIRMARGRAGGVDMAGPFGRVPAEVACRTVRTTCFGSVSISRLMLFASTPVSDPSAIDNSSRGARPGVIRTQGHEAESANPGSPAVLSRGNTPACTIEDFPAPDAPDMTMSPPVRRLDD